jgi:hypothetical protein
MYTAIFLLFTLLLAYSVLYPILSNSESDQSSEEKSAQEGKSERANLNDQRERCIQVLRDLELDFATGKITHDEYQKIRSSVGRELIAIVDALSV